MFICPDCKETGSHYAKGLCAKCYARKSMLARYHAGKTKQWKDVNYEAYHAYMKPYQREYQRKRRERIKQEGG